MDDMEGDEPLDDEQWVDYDVATELMKSQEQIVMLLAQAVQELAAIKVLLASPKRVLRDERGGVAGIEPVQRG